MSNDALQPPRQSMDVDIACVGFGPAMAGFLTTLSRGLVKDGGTPVAESTAMPGMPPQVICYERADDLGFGVSGVVTRARAIKASFPELTPESLPMASPVAGEKVVYLLDPHGVSRKPKSLRAVEAPMKLLAKKQAFELPYIPDFLKKHDGWVLGLGQFMQWAGADLMAAGLVQVWPGTPVSEPLFDGSRVVGVRLTDQGVDKQGAPEAGFMPGMDIKARLTVVGDGPVGPVGRKLDQKLGMPPGHAKKDWAVGMKAVVELPENCPLLPGTVLHTLGYPEPEIFGFMYVYPDRLASLGIFVPSWFDSPVRTAYRYLQHWMLHPYIHQHLDGGALRSWGAKTLGESGKAGEPWLVGDGFARIGEGSGTTNVLTGSGVDEAWLSGVLLGQAVIELLASGKDFTKQNLDAAYVRRRRDSRLEREAQEAAKAREGFGGSVMEGLLGMALSGFSKGRINWPGDSRLAHKRIPTVEEFFRGRLEPSEIARIRAGCKAKGQSLHGALMDAAGWPAIPYDGKLFMSHQDALLMGGKVQAPPGYADHVRFVDETICRGCKEQVCIEACSGQAITANPEDGPPLFDREKCVHCGVCLWNCSKSRPGDPKQSNVEFTAGAGGLHSAEN